MSRLIDRLLVVVYVALAALPAVAMLLGWTGRKLEGSLPPTKLPAFRFSGVLTERIQKGIASWFESNLGLKGTSIALDNAVLYHAFGETKPGSGVRVGKDHVLFSHEDIDYYNKHAGLITDPAYVNRLADQIASVQRRFQARGQAFVPLIIPSKSSIWRDKIPDEWTMALPFPRAADETTRMIRQALALRGVVFVDARTIFERSKSSRVDLWGPDARHWTQYGACLAMTKVIDAYAKLTQQPRPPHRCEYVRKTLPITDDDFDLFRLLNAKWVDPALADGPVITHDRPAITSSRPRVLFTGTSFCWTIMRDAHNSGVFANARMNYYNQSFVEASAGSDVELVAVEAGTPYWREHVMTNELIVLDLFESYLANPGTYVELFLNDVTKELETQ